jgi:hypothetical protein
MLWDSRGASQVRASIGQMESGLGHMRREMRGASHEQGLLDKQMRAFGTTLRYALAGGALFGTVSAIRNLGEFQAKLGEISAIGSKGGLDLTGRQLDDLGAKILKVSTDTAIPVSEIQEAIVNLYSTIEDITPDQAVRAIETIARTARISQADITDTTQALLGLVNAYNRSPNEIPKFGNEFFQVTRLSAGGANFAAQYAQQLGNISATGRLSRFTPEETMALTIAGSRFGGSAARNLRGQAQLQRNILNPGNKKSESFYDVAGVGKANRASMTGMEVLMKLLTYANTLNENQKGTFLKGAFTRAESLGQATMYSQLLTRSQIAPGSKNKTIAEYLDDVKNSAGEADKAMDRAMDMRRIQQAGNAMSNFSIAFAGAFNPILQPTAKGIVGATSRFQDLSHDHPNAVMGGALGIGAALIALRKFTTRGPGLGGLAAVGAVGDTLSGSKVRGDSPMNPLYVIVVSQLLGGKNYMPGRNQFPGGQGPAQMPPVVGGRFGRFSKIGALLGAGTLARMASMGAPEMAIPMVLESLGIKMDYMKPKDTSAFPRINRLLHRDIKKRPFESLSPAEQQALKLTRDYGGFGPFGQKSGMTAPRLKAAESLLEGALGQGISVHGSANVTVNIDHTDAKGNTKRTTTSVPVPLFGAFTTPAPQTKGRPKTARK